MYSQPVSKLEIQQSVALGPLTTLGVGGPARYFAVAESEADVAEAVAWAGERKLPLFVLGGGSNLLVSDAGFEPVVVGDLAKTKLFDPGTPVYPKTMTAKEIRAALNLN